MGIIISVWPSIVNITHNRLEHSFSIINRTDIDYLGADQHKFVSICNYIVEYLINIMDYNRLKTDR